MEARTRCFFKLLCAFYILCAAMAEPGNPRFPTYDHPLYKNQKCFKCPPGYYLYEHCANKSKDGSASWPDCRLCSKSRYTQKWNTDRQCQMKVQCEKSHKEIYNGKHLGPIQCACPAAMNEVDGICVEAMSLDDQKKNYTITLADAKVKCQEDCDATSQLKIVVAAMGFVIGLLMVCLLACIYKICSDRVAMKKSRGKNSFPVEAKWKWQPNTIESRTSNTNASEFDDLNATGTLSTIGRRNSGETGQHIDFVDEASRILEKKVMAPDVDRFVRHVLHFHAEDCDKVKEYKTKCEQIRAAISIWKTGAGAPKNFQEPRDVEVLVRVLQENDRRDLAVAVTKKLRLVKQGLHVDPSSTDKFDEACRICEEKITSLQDILKFARKSLLHDESFISSVKGENNVMRLCLNKWKAANGEKATVKQLVEFLMNMKRSPYTDIADQINCDVMHLELDDESNEATSLLKLDTKNINGGLRTKQNVTWGTRQQHHSPRISTRSSVRIEDGNISLILHEGENMDVEAGPKIQPDAIRETQQPESQESPPLNRPSGSKGNADRRAKKSNRLHKEMGVVKNMAGPKIQPGAIRETQQPESIESSPRATPTSSRRDDGCEITEATSIHKEMTEEKNKATADIRRPLSQVSPSFGRQRRFRQNAQGATVVVSLHENSAAGDNNENQSWWEYIRTALSDGIRTVPANMGRLVGIVPSGPTTQNFATVPREHVPLSELQHHSRGKQEKVTRQDL